MPLSAINNSENSTASQGLFKTSASCPFCPGSVPVPGAGGSPLVERSQVWGISEFLLLDFPGNSHPPARTKGPPHFSRLRVLYSIFLCRDLLRTESRGEDRERHLCPVNGSLVFS